MSSRRTEDIEALSEQLRSLQITEEASSKYEQITTEEISTVPALMVVTGQENIQAGLLKNIVLDLGWFDSNQTKFEDWWRRIGLFLKSN